MARQSSLYQTVPFEFSKVFRSRRTRPVKPICNLARKDHRPIAGAGADEQEGGHCIQRQGAIEPLALDMSALLAGGAARWKI